MTNLKGLIHHCTEDFFNTLSCKATNSDVVDLLSLKLAVIWTSACPCKILNHFIFFKKVTWAIYHALNNSGLTSRVSAGKSLSECLFSAWTTTGSQTSFRTWLRSVWTAWLKSLSCCPNTQSVFPELQSHFESCYCKHHTTIQSIFLFCSTLYSINNF